MRKSSPFRFVAVMVFHYIADGRSDEPLYDDFYVRKTLRKQGNDMEVRTRTGTVDIYEGARFAEMAIAGCPFLGMCVMEALSEPDVSVRSDGYRYYTWKARDVSTGEVTVYGVSEETTAYAPKLYPMDSPLVVAWLERLDDAASEAMKKKRKSDESDVREEVCRKETDGEQTDGHAAGGVEKTIGRTAQPSATAHAADGGEGRDIGCGIAVTTSGKSFTLINRTTGKRREFVSENGQVLMDDSEIDLESIHRRFEHCWCADEKHARYRFGLYCGFEDGMCALSWTIYPDGRYFSDDGGFGADDNGEENVYCIINTDMEVVVPFRPMDDVREELRRAAQHTHRDNRCRDDNGTSVD